MSQAAEAKTGVELEFLLPKVATLWVDSWVIPADAKNIENAHLFINYMMRPQVGANDTNYTWYATANKDALAMVDEEVRTNQAAFPTPGQVATMYTAEVLPPKINRLRTRTWTNFKAGN
jgi:putrescine transport system substrate-binding protein